MRDYLALSLAVCLACSCASYPPAAPSGLSHISRADTSRTSLVRPPDTGDTEMDLFPDPRERTQHRMRFYYRFIREYRRDHGRLPERLEQLLSPAGSLPSEVNVDAWGHSFLYTPRGEGYEIRSAGPDGNFGTDDDMVTVENSVPPAPQRW